MSENLDSFEPGRPPHYIAAWIGVVVGLVFPTIATWVYFVLASDAAEDVQRATGLAMKSLQFVFPVIWVWCVLNEPASWFRPRVAGVTLGLAFGLVISLSGWVLFQQVLRESAVFVAAAEAIRAKIAGFGIDSLAKYAALGAFYSLVHSLLEEYYWRWFVFGQLRRLVPVGAAITVSAVGFMAHHVLVLAMFFGWWSWFTLLFSAAVAVGGAFWAWLYHRSGSLNGPWLSHLLVDAGIFVVGLELVRDMLT